MFSLRGFATASVLLLSSTVFANPYAAPKGGSSKPAEGPGQGSLNVTGTPEAEIIVDGEKVSQTPLPLPLPMPVGDHTIKVTKVGYAPYIDVFKIRKNKETKVEVDLVPIAGIVNVTSTVPNSRVFVDGKFVGEAPISTEIPVGAVAVQVSKGGYRDFFQNIMGVAGKEVKLEVKLIELPPELNPYVVKPLPPAKLYEKWWLWTAIVGGAAVVAVAVAVPVTLGTRDPVSSFGPTYQFNVGALRGGK